LKQERNAAIHNRRTGLTISDVYVKRIEGGRVIKVAGNPNFSNVRTIMIGIRNPLQNNHYFEDDGMPKSVEVWCDELRLSDFDEGLLFKIKRGTNGLNFFNEYFITLEFFA